MKFATFTVPEDRRDDIANSCGIQGEAPLAPEIPALILMVLPEALVLRVRVLALVQVMPLLTVMLVLR